MHIKAKLILKSANLKKKFKIFTDQTSTQSAYSSTKNKSKVGEMQLYENNTLASARSNVYPRCELIHLSCAKLEVKYIHKTTAILLKIYTQNNSIT